MCILFSGHEVVRYALYSIPNEFSEIILCWTIRTLCDNENDGNDNDNYNNDSDNDRNGNGNDNSDNDIMIWTFLQAD